MRTTTTTDDPGPGPLVVTGLEGGVGASSLAAHCAVWWGRAALAAAGGPDDAGTWGRRDAPGAVVVDLDPAGAGLDVLLGTEGVPGVRWPELLAGSGDVDGEHLLRAMPTWRGAAVLTGGSPLREGFDPGVVAGVLDALGPWARVVVDLPRADWSSPLGAGLRARAGATSAWCVTSGVTGVGAGVGRPAAERADGLVVRTRARAALSALDVSRSLGVPLWATVRTRAATAVAVDWGRGPGETPRGAGRSADRALRRTGPGRPVGLAAAGAAVCTASDRARHERARTRW